MLWSTWLFVFRLLLSLTVFVGLCDHLGWLAQVGQQKGVVDGVIHVFAVSLVFAFLVFAIVFILFFLF